MSDESEDDKNDSQNYDKDDVIPDGEQFCAYAGKGKLDKIQEVMENPDFVDLMMLSGLEKEVTIDDSEYNTELWNPLLFAIFYNQTEVVKYFIEECNVNLVACMMDPEIRENELDKNQNLNWEPSDAMFGYFLAVHRKNVDILNTLWNGSRS